MKKKIFLSVIVLLLGIGVYLIANKVNLNRNYQVGQAIDSLNHVIVYYNGAVDHVGGRHLTKDHYNLGLKYQCVEFVKRYYYEHFHHKMPDSYGHAKDFFDGSLADGQFNAKRNLIQYAHPSKERPEKNDLIVFSGTPFNPYGHVAIVSNVWANKIEIIQQNPGPFASSRDTFSLAESGKKWEIGYSRILGWLRMVPFSQP
jgi:surface antigen